MRWSPLRMRLPRQCAPREGRSGRRTGRRRNTEPLRATRPGESFSKHASARLGGQSLTPPTVQTAQTSGSRHSVLIAMAGLGFELLEIPFAELRHLGRDDYLAVGLILVVPIVSLVVVLGHV